MPLQKKTLKGNFQASKQAEREFQRALKKVARASGHIVEAHVDGITIKGQQKMTKSLEAYAELLGPWAERQATNMTNLVKKSNQKAYKQKAKALSNEIQVHFKRPYKRLNAFFSKEVGESGYVNKKRFMGMACR